MLRLLIILIVVTLCFLGGLKPLAATDLCPPLYVKAGQTCACFVFNYSTTTDDTGVNMRIYTPDFVDNEGPFTVQKEDWAGVFIISNDGICSCKVTGEGTTLRTTLMVLDNGGSVLTSVHCF